MSYQLPVTSYRIVSSRCRAGWVAVLLSCTTALAAEPRPIPPAEELRLNTVQFREWLKARGLTELLDLHLRDFPPTDSTATLLMMRDVKLAQFADRSRSTEERRAAIAEADRILEQLVRDLPQDRRRLTWQYTLAYSLLYDEAEPYATNILYFGGSAEDRDRLSGLMKRALDTVRSLTHFIAEEYTRIDRLSVEEFEELERRGYLEELDRLAPSADYLLLWVLFYDALPRSDGDPTRAAELREILDTLAIKPAFIQTPHDKSRIQVQASLLAGMTHRRVNDHASARENLDRALIIAERFTDQAEKARLAWAIALAGVEAARNERDDGRLDSAIAATARLKNWGKGQKDPFALRFVAALLERSIHRARAAAQEKAGRVVEANASREQAWMSLARVVSDYPDRKDTIYSTIFNQLDAKADPVTLDPFEQCALMTGLIAQAERQPESSRELLDRAVALGEYWLSHPTDNAQLLAPEVLFELGVSHYRGGDRLAAARRLIEVAGQYPRSGPAFPAANLAVQLAAELYGEQPTPPEITRLYRRALETLLDQYHHTEEAGYWRFFYAQLLDESGEFAAAEREYSKVDAAHDHFVEAGFLALRAAFSELQRLSSKPDAAVPSLSAGADKVIALYRDFTVRAKKVLGDGASGERQASARRLLAEAQVVAAEAFMLEGVNRAQQAIELLADFEEAAAEGSHLTARVWRVRLLAYQALGRLDEAASALPKYVAADSAHAGTTLQTLYTSLSNANRPAGPDAARNAQRTAELALLLAQQLVDWSAKNDPSVIGMDRRALRVQLAEAHLRAGHAQEAQKIFQETAAAKQDGQADRATDILASFGQAEAAFQQGRFAEALPTYNKLATTLAVEHPLRWKALLRDLQCRTALKEPPAGILKVIEQQKFLFPDLGGPEMAAEFERLKRENERR